MGQPLFSGTIFTVLIGAIRHSQFGYLSNRLLLKYIRLMIGIFICRLLHDDLNLLWWTMAWITRNCHVIFCHFYTFCRFNQRVGVAPLPMCQSMWWNGLIDQHNNHDMHHGTCVTHVQRCMPGSLTSGFLWNRWRGKRFRHSRRMLNGHFTYLARDPFTNASPVHGGICVLQGFNKYEKIHRYFRICKPVRTFLCLGFCRIML